MSDETVVRSQCPYCGVGCGVRLTVRAGEVVKVQGDPDHPANRGQLCVKGATLAQMINPPTRLAAAAVRPHRAPYVVQVPLADAIKEAAVRLQAIIERDGPGAVGFYLSGQLTTEANYAINKFAKGLIGTNHVDANSRLCMASAVAGYTQAFGSDGPPCSYSDIEAADCFFVIGGNPAECHPVLYRRIEQQVRQRGARLVVVDPRRTATARHADLHLAVRPGTDTALLNGLLHILARDGHLDPAYIRDHTSGWDALEPTLPEWTPEATAATTGLTVAAIEEAARLFAASDRTLSLWTMGVNQSRNGVAKVAGIINLHLATGKIGRPGCGPFSLTGQPNAMGGREVGYLAHQLPGYRQITNPTHRSEIEQVWDVPTGSIGSEPGYHATAMFDALANGELKAIWIVGTNPLVSLPNLAVVERALERAELVIVQDLYATSETLRYADIILPAAQWIEQQGTFTASDRHVTLLNPAVAPPGDALPDWELVQLVAQQMGYPMNYRNAADIYAEFARCTAGRHPLDHSGITYERLAAGPVQWPCPKQSHPGTERLYDDQHFATSDGRARFQPAVYVPPDEIPDATYPFWLTSGRVLEHWHSRTRTREVPRLNQRHQGSFVEIHPADAATLDITAGEPLAIYSRRGRTTALAQLNPDLPAGTLFMPIHWEDGNPNWVANPALDPVSRQPELKASAVWVAPVRRALSLRHSVGDTFRQPQELHDARL